MQPETRRYFPELRFREESQLTEAQKKGFKKQNSKLTTEYLSIRDLIDAHERAIYDVVGAKIDNDTYFNPLGKELELQKKEFINENSAANPILISTYFNIVADFEETSKDYTQQQKAALAAKYHADFSKCYLEFVKEKFKKYPEDVQEKILQQTEPKIKFLSKQADDFYLDFGTRTSVPFSSVIMEVEKERSKEIMRSNIPLAEKKEKINQLKQEISKEFTKFSNINLEISRREMTERDYVYKKDDINARKERIQDEARLFLETDLEHFSQNKIFAGLTENNQNEIANCMKVLKNAVSDVQTSKIQQEQKFEQQLEQKQEQKQERQPFFKRKLERAHAAIAERLQQFAAQ